MTETPISVTIRELEQFVGPFLVAVVSGTHNRHIVKQWLDDDQYREVIPTPDEARRIEFALEQFNRVSQSVGEELARAWFIGKSVGDKPPYLAIRAGNLIGAWGSASTMINDTWA